MSEIFVKIVRVPGAVTEVGLNQGATVGDALDAAGIESNSAESLKVGSANVDRNYTLVDGDRVVHSIGAKGN